MIEVSSSGAAPVAPTGAPPLADRTRVAIPSFYSLRRYQRLVSTNDEAKSLAGAGAAEGTLVWAREQSQGRGRQGRVWASPPGNFYASMVLRPATKPEAAAQLGFAAALAVREACIDFAPEAAISFKWPNDVLLGGRKLAGILLESQMRGDGRIDWLVVGIGINLVTYPLATEYPATALSAEGVEIAPDAMLGAVARRFLAWYQRWREQLDFEALREAWLRQAHGIGAVLRVRRPNGQLSGRFAGLDGDGALLLDTAEGLHRVEAGEVFPAASVA